MVRRVQRGRPTIACTKNISKGGLSADSKLHVEMFQWISIRDRSLTKSPLHEENYSLSILFPLFTICPPTANLFYTKNNIWTTWFVTKYRGIKHDITTYIIRFLFTHFANKLSICRIFLCWEKEWVTIMTGAINHQPCGRTKHCRSSPAFAYSIDL